MNICIIASTYFPELNGVSIHIRNMAHEYVKRGHKVLVLCPDYSVAKDLFSDYQDYLGAIEENVLVKPVPSQDIHVMEDSRIVQFAHWSEWNLDDYLGDFQPDALIVEDPARIFDLSVFGIPGATAYGKSIGIEYARRKGIPVLATYQTNYSKHMDYILPEQVPTPYRLDKSGTYQKIFGEYDLVLCACNEVLKYVAGHGLGNGKAGPFLGINQNIFLHPEKSNLVTNDESVKLFYAGKLVKDKDIHYTLEIYQNLRAACPNVIMYIAGGGEGEAALQELSRKDSSIRFLGKLNQMELVKVYNSVDIYLSPHPSETFGLSIVEAMSRGLPVVAADSGGPKDLVENGVRGFLCTTMDEYIDALKLLVRDSSLRFRFGQNGMEFAQKYYCDKCAENVLYEINRLKEAVQ